MQTRLLYLFTRTPLHVGAGSSVGAIDQPIIRERHTQFPIIPASSLKGSFADQWNGTLGQPDRDGRRWREAGEAAWLFGSDDAREEKAAAGALLFGEARLLAFPIRSARGSFAWITSPLLLRRAARDGVFAAEVVAAFEGLAEPGDGQARFPEGKLELTVRENNHEVQKVVLEEYTFARAGDLPAGLGAAMQALVPGDPVWAEVASRLVILSDGQLSFFASTACEVAQHVRINDETGTADPGGLFNQENIPSETLFYAVIRATGSRLRGTPYAGNRIAYQPPTPAGQAQPARIDKLVKDLDETDAFDAFAAKIETTSVFQFGGDASTGLGYCTPRLA